MVSTGPAHHLLLLSPAPLSCSLTYGPCPSPTPPLFCFSLLLSCVWALSITCSFFLLLLSPALPHIGPAYHLLLLSPASFSFSPSYSLFLLLASAFFFFSFLL